jgi:Protein of unknown function (DUF3421)
MVGTLAAGFSDEYVARVDHAGSLVVGYAVKTGSRIRVFVPFAGQAHQKYFPEASDLEILVNRKRRALLAWLPCKDGVIPTWAVPGGRDNVSQEPYYIGRVPEGAGPHRKIGKVHPSHRCLYYALGGAEVGTREYEVLAVLEC